MSHFTLYDKTKSNIAPLFYFSVADIEDTPAMTSAEQLFFHGLTTRCEGILQAVSFYAVQAGSFSLDLWLLKEGFTDTYTLYYTTKLTASIPGPVYHRLTHTLRVLRGLTVGTHSDPALAHTLGVTYGNGSYKLWRTNRVEGQFYYGSSEIGDSDNIDADPLYATPALQLHITSTPNALNGIYILSPFE